MRTRLILLTIWCCFLARALFYCAAMPLWEGYDEYSHFDLIQYVVTHHGRFPLGTPRPNGSRAVAESRTLTPGAWIFHDASQGILSYEEYFSLASPEQNARRTRLETIPLAQWSREEAAPEQLLYEAQQPPLYYWILALFYELLQGFSLPSIVWMLRSFTVLIASTAIPLAYLCGRRIFRDDALALGVALITASFPELLIDIARVGNEGLSVAIGALFVLLALRTAEDAPTAGSGALLGIALGAALLTKAYFLALVPLAAVAVWYAWVRNAATRSRAVWQAAAAVGSSMALSGWWYVRNVVITGTLTGQSDDVQGMANGHVSWLATVSHAHWARVFDFILVSHIWLGGWSFLVVRAWMYRVVELMLLAAAAGVCVQAVRERSGLPRAKELGLVALPYLVMTTGLFFQAAEAFRARGSAGTVGFYLYALVVPECILLIAGLARLLPPKPAMRLLPVPIAAFVLIGLEQFGAWFVLFPYYAGLIRHNASGALPAARISQFRNGGLSTLFERLSGIGPASSPSVLAVMAVLYMLATAILLFLAYKIARPRRYYVPAAIPG